MNKLLMICGVLTLLVVCTVVLMVAPGRVRTFVSDITLPYRFGLSRQSDLHLPMRDGVRLTTDVYLPVGEGEGPWPVILIRSPYGGYEFDDIRRFVREGYAVVYQDERGRYRSEGTFVPSKYSGPDSYDTMTWIAAQSWSNGRIGTFGCSYLGESQYLVSRLRHPNHRAIIAEGAGGAIGSASGSYSYFGMFENGVFGLAGGLGWFVTDGASEQRITPAPRDLDRRLVDVMDQLPPVELASRIVPYRTAYEDFLTHPLTDLWWRTLGYISDDDRFATPALHVNAMFDPTARGTFALARLMARNGEGNAAEHQHVVFGPGQHCSARLTARPTAVLGERSVENADPGYWELFINWFDYWLKDRPVPLPPPFLVHVFGTDRWVALDRWPGDGERHLYLAPSDPGVDRPAGSPHRLVAEPEAVSGSWQFRYDPADPVPSRGGSICCTGQDEDVPGSFDQADLALRPDVLAFAGTPLAEPLTVAGEPRVVLHVTTDARDTDFTAKLLDVYPDGRAFNVQDSVVRMRYRNGVAAPAFAVPGQTYRVEVAFGPVAYRFPAGHRIGLQVSSSNFPRFARNLNTGENEYAGTRMAVATNTVFYGADMASRLSLPVIDLTDSPGLTAGGL